MIKAVSKLKKFFVRPRKKRRRKTYPLMYHEFSRYYNPPPPPARPPPPPPPFGYYFPYSTTSTEPSAPPLPPWLDIIDQTQDSISGHIASETDYPSQTHFSSHEIIAETSPVCPTLFSSNNSSSIPSPSPYHQYMSPNPAAGVPVLHQESLGGFFGAVVDFFGCFCPCFRVPEDSEKRSIS